MKIKHLLLIVCLLCSSFISAQKSGFNSLFDKYQNEDDITVISISKAMFNLFPGNINLNIDIRNIVPKIEYLRVITTANRNLNKQMALEFKSLIDKDKTYEELMRIKEGGSNITFNIKKNGDIINELIMLINENDEFVAIQILGNFTIEDIQKISKR